MSAPLIAIRQVVKPYQSLRPLRVRELLLEKTSQLVLRGFDEGAAEMFIHLVTGAALPEEGSIEVAGRDTREIATDTEWLESLDKFGIVTHRAVLIDKLSLASNLALPLTMSIEPIPPDIRKRVDQLARDSGFEAASLDREVSELSEENRLRLHLARAIANGPEMVLLEHPTSRLADPAASARIGQTLKLMSSTHSFGWIALTEDQAFADAAGGDVLALNAATGELAAPKRGWRKWFV